MMGDVITDAAGASGIATTPTGTSTISLRWINGTKWFTIGSAVSVNGVPSGLTVAGIGNGPASGNADSIFIYDGYQNIGGTSTACYWNNTATSKALTMRIWR